MTVDTNVLRAILMYLGIKDLQIRFDPGNCCIRVDYEHYNEHCCKVLTFAEIEGLFTPSARASAGRPVSDRALET